MTKPVIDPNLPEIVDASEEFGILVVHVTAILVRLGHPRPDEWLPFLDPTAAQSNSLEYQRFLINRAWRLILSDYLTESTMDQRYCLVDTGSYVRWLEILEKEVLTWATSRNWPAVKN